MTSMLEVKLLEEAKAIVALAEKEERPYAIALRMYVRERLHANRLTWLVSDFCDTLAGRQWLALRKAITPDARALDEAFLDAFLHQPKPTSEEENAQQGAWIGADVNLLANEGFTRARVEALGAGLPLRPGARELLTSFPERQRLIASFGIVPIVQGCLARHDLTADIAASEIIFFEEKDGIPRPTDRVRCVDPRTIVTGPTKGLAARAWLGRKQCPFMTRVLAIGDDPRVDRELWHPDSFNVLVAPWNEKQGACKVDRLELDDLTKRKLALIVSDLETLNDLLAA